MDIELVGLAGPSWPEVSVGVQRRDEVLQVRPGDGTEIHWRLDATLGDGPDLRGPWVHGRPGARFLYLSWLRSGEMFRRAKLMLGAVPADLLSDPTATLVGRFGLAMPDGSPLCAAVRPPQVSWSAR